MLIIAGYVSIFCDYGYNTINWNLDFGFWVVKKFSLYPESSEIHWESLIELVSFFFLNRLKQSQSSTLGGMI